MLINKTRSLSSYDIGLSIIISLLIYLLFSNFSILNDLLGSTSVNNSFKKPYCDETNYFCRPAFVKFIYYYLGKLINIDVIIYFQIYLYVFSITLIRIQCVNLKLNEWIINILVIILLFNPKNLKYVFSTEEESFYLPILLIIISLIIKLIVEKKYKNLIYFNIAFAILLLVRPAAIIFYIIALPINIVYLINIKKDIFKNFYFISLFCLMILIVPFFVNNSLNKHYISKSVNNNYFSMHALSSLIAKQKNTHFEDEISQLINIQITKLNEVRKIGNFNLTSKLHFECVIFPAMNNPIYKEKLILNFFQINKKLNLNKKLFNLYVKNFLKNPATFLWSFQQCFFANSMLADILTQKETDDINKILLNSIFNDNDKRIILDFQDDTKNYKNVITKIRFFNLCLLSISIISFILSIKSIISKK